MAQKNNIHTKLVDYVKNNCAKGNILTHTVIEGILGIAYKKNCNCANGQYRYYVQKANNVLTEMSLRLESVIGVGYRVIEDKEYLESARKEINAGARHIEKADIILSNVTVSALNAKEQADLTKLKQKVTHLRSTLTYVPPVRNRKVTP